MAVALLGTEKFVKQEMAAKRLQRMRIVFIAVGSTIKKFEY